VGDDLGAVQATIDAINGRDAVAVARTLAPQAVFVDAHGNRFQGRAVMREGWRLYYETFPDYRIEVDKLQQVHGGVLVLGHASGSFRGRAERSWRIPIAVRAETEDGLVALWQVFADTHLPFQSMTE
jgi:ketosteroid isomerase-like protein